MRGSQGTRPLTLEIDAEPAICPTRTNCGKLDATIVNGTNVQDRNAVVVEQEILPDKKLEPHVF